MYCTAVNSHLSVNPQGLNQQEASIVPVEWWNICAFMDSYKIRYYVLLTYLRPLVRF